MQAAWDRGQDVRVYGLIYSLRDGLIKKLAGSDRIETHVVRGGGEGLRVTRRGSRHWWPGRCRHATHVLRPVPQPLILSAAPC